MDSEVHDNKLFERELERLQIDLWKTSKNSLKRNLVGGFSQLPTQVLPQQLSVRQASAIFNIPEWTLRSYIHRRLIPYRKLRGKIYIPTEKFQKYLSKFDVDPITDETALLNCDKATSSNSTKRRNYENE
jgi:hypothetical protein